MQAVPTKVVAREPSGSTTAEVARPPVLASESLREDIAPTEPGRRTLRIAGTVLGLLGAATTFLVGGKNPGVMLLVACLALDALLCAVPMRYAVRATGVFAVTALGLAAATFVRLAYGTPATSGLLALGAMVLAGGLFFRAVYRASKRARATVALGIALLVTWIVMAGGFSQLTHLDPGWQTWAPAAMRVGWGLLLVLSLLAFMEQGSTGGAQVWAMSVVVWHALYVALELSVALWPHDAQAGVGSLAEKLSELLPVVGHHQGPGVLVAACFGAMALVPIGALALSHVLTVTAGGTAPQRNNGQTNGRAGS